LAGRRLCLAIRWAPSNITDHCDRSIQPRIDAALEGHVDIADVIDGVQPRQWNMSTVLPILQVSSSAFSEPLLLVSSSPDARLVRLSTVCFTRSPTLVIVDRQAP
jgi:hypothetical protein